MGARVMGDQAGFLLPTETLCISFSIEQVAWHVCRPQTPSSKKQRTRYLDPGDGAHRTIVPRAIQVGCVTLQANPYRGGIK
jgi:hypothetical protein